MGKRRVGRPRKKKRKPSAKKFSKFIYKRNVKVRKARKKATKRRLPPRVKSGKNKGRFRKR